MRPHSEIDFRNASDSGEAESAAIQPYTNGEPANQTVLRRPTENNRTRSDVLRSILREMVILADIDRNMAVHGGGTITWGGAAATYTGQFTLGADLNLMPFATPGGSVTVPYVESTNAVLSVGTPSTNELVFTSKFRQWEQTGADPDIAKDANRISIEIRDTGSVSVAVEGATGEENNIVIGVDFGTSTCQNVIDAVTADVNANKLVTVTLGSGTLGSATSPKFSEAEWGTDFSVRYLRGGAGGTVHVITNANLSAFWGAHAENPLKKGDTLAIWYDQLLELATDGGRFQSVPENSNITIPSGALFNTRREPEKIPNCVPICKCIDDDTLLFIDGSYIVRGIPATLTEDSFGGGNGSIDSSSWVRIDAAPGPHVPPSTIQETLNNTDAVIDAAMTEIENARSSALTGAHANLDTRLEQAEGFFPTYVLDAAGSSGHYTGATAFSDAIVALATGSASGATMILRPGTYTMPTSNIVLTKRIWVVAAAEGVTIQFNSFNLDVVDGTMFTGINFTDVGTLCQIYCYDRVLFHDCTFTNVRVDFDTVSAAVHAVEGGMLHCRFYYNIAGSNGINAYTQAFFANCHFENTANMTFSFISTSGSTGAKSVFRNCNFVLSNQEVALTNCIGCTFKVAATAPPATTSLIYFRGGILLDAYIYASTTFSRTLMTIDAATCAQNINIQMSTISHNTGLPFINTRKTVIDQLDLTFTWPDGGTFLATTPIIQLDRSTLQNSIITANRASATSTQGRLIYVKSSGFDPEKRSKMDNVVVRLNGFVTGSAGTRHAVYIDDVEGVTIRDCQFLGHDAETDIQDFGDIIWCSLNTIKYLTIDNCVFRADVVAANTRRAIKLDFTSAVTVGHISVINNKFHWKIGHPVEIKGRSGQLIEVVHFMGNSSLSGVAATETLDFDYIDNLLIQGNHSSAGYSPTNITVQKPATLADLNS